MYEAPPRTVLPPELDPRTGRHSPSRQGVKRALALLTVALSVLIVLASTGGYVVVRWFNGSIARIQLNFGDNRPPEAAKGEQNWVLAGTDSRAGTGSEYGGSAVEGERSDTTIVAHLDRDGTTTLMSIPRDTLVTIPAYNDDKGIAHPAHQDKFNSAIMLGGASLMVRTIEEFTGIRVDHYVSVDLAGFKQITDAIGGVDVCIKRSGIAERTLNDAGTEYIRSTNLDDPFSGFTGKVGQNHLNGDQALAFVRQRHGLEGGDTARIRRQQQFLGQVFRQSTATGVLLNPGRVSSLIGAVRDALTLDQDTSLSDLEKLAGRMRGLDAAKLRFETVPTRDLKPDDPNAITIGGSLQYKEPGAPRAIGAVQLVLEPQYDELLARLKGTQALPPSSAPSNEAPAPVTVPPSQVLVSVQNGTTTSGVARRATAALAEGGFRTNAPAVADASTYGASEVRFAPGEEESAKTVSAAVPGSVLKADVTATNGIVLVVGSSYTGTRPVNVLGASSRTASPTTSPSASATPSTAPPPVTAADADNRCTY
ncbi:MAG TPA: LCP family protein [Frankiaceae bacterium]|nr:LCP family protein [Frankiaceae bacterium]